MVKNKIISPECKLEKFTCPHCGAITGQLWGNLTAGGGVKKKIAVPSQYIPALRGYQYWNNVFCAGGDEWVVSLCENCKKICIWRNEIMIFPDIVTAEDPNEDLPEDIKNDYFEAASILNKSPRGSAALLRLCVQKLCMHLGKSGKNLNDDIGELVKEGLPEKVAKAMDSLRVIGNNAVHPGELDMADNIEIATKLFELVNFIAEKMITEPKEIDSFYNKTVPESAKKAINARDKK